VTRIGKLGATLAITSNRRMLRRNTKYKTEGQGFKTQRGE
jgi:hypothetical protein